MDKAIIFAGGTINGYYKEKYINYDVICVDKGLDYATKNNLNISIAIGDFDSASEKSLQYMKDNNLDILKFNREKDMTDLELSFLYCKEKGYKEILVFGALGTRMDHSISNIFLLKTYSDDNFNIILIDENNYIFYINKNIIIKKNKIYNYLSLLPTNEKCILNLSGTKWELKKHNLDYGSSLTVSNEFKSDAFLEIIYGDLFVILSKD